jgi:transcriptional regulator with XRE-family HTH domain
LNQSKNIKALGSLIRKLRQAKSLTIRDLASSNAISFGSIQKIENGEVSDPRIDTIDAICKALGSDQIERSKMMQLAGYEMAAGNHYELLSADELEHIQILRALSPGQLRTVFGVTKTVLEMEQSEKA